MNDNIGFEASKERRVKADEKRSEIAGIGDCFGRAPEGGHPEDTHRVSMGTRRYSIALGEGVVLMGKAHTF